jgi:streptogramin lyase
MRTMTAMSVALALTWAALPNPAAAEGAGIIAIPPQLEYPEGIAVDAQGRLYLASALDGTVLRMGPDGGSAQVILGPGKLVPMPSEIFPVALGVKLDALGRLWILGGRTGQIFVLNPDSGVLLAKLAVPSQGITLNDGVILPGAAYITDTAQPFLWRVALDGAAIGQPEPWIDFKGTVLAYGPGRNLNGIVADASGRFLIVIQMDKGLLFRIDTATKAITSVEVGGGPITNGDGLVLDGQTLYLARQAEGEIVTLRMSTDFSSASVVSRFRDPALGWLGTAVKAGDRLLVVNSQFDRRAAGNPIKPFRLASIPLEKLAGK